MGICIDSCGNKNFVSLKTNSKRPKNGGFPIGISFSRGRFFRGYVSFRDPTGKNAGNEVSIELEVESRDLKL